VEHLDILDPRRDDLFSDAECRDCEYFAGASPVLWDCDAESYVRTEITAALREANPDAVIPGIRIMPNSDDKASRCPGFNPSADYLDELASIANADAAMRREDMDRLAAMGRRAA
jgi:hypothetical protein